MGAINHNLLAATSCIQEVIQGLEDWISQLSPREQRLITSVDGLFGWYRTFLVIPDGSKEGWDESDFTDSLRQRFIARLEKDNYEDSSPWAWVEIGWGEFGQAILQGNNSNCYNEAAYAIPLPDPKLRCPWLESEEVGDS